MKMRHERPYIRDGSGPDESESETCSQDVSDGDLEATKAVCVIAFCYVEIKIDSGPDSTLQNVHRTRQFPIASKSRVFVICLLGSTEMTILVAGPLSMTATQAIRTRQNSTCNPMCLVGQCCIASC